MVAAQVFKEGGYDKATMRTIAEKVGLKEPSLYHHIKSKDQMLYEIVKGATQAGVSRISYIRAMRIPADEKIRLCFKAHFDSLLKSYPEVSVLIHEKISLLRSEQAKEIRKLYRKYVHIISDIIAKGIQDKVFKNGIDVKLSTWAFLGMESIWRMVEYYLARWKCDESYRYIKQCYNLEDVRVQSYISIRNIVVLVLAVSYFASVYLGQTIKLKMLVERIFIVSKRFFGVPSFFNYAIADGIFNLLYPDKTALRGVKQNSLDDFQLCFEFG